MALDDEFVYFMEFVEFVKSNSDIIIQNSKINIMYDIFTIKFHKLHYTNSNLYRIELCYSNYGELDYYYRFIANINIKRMKDFNKIKFPYLNAIRNFEKHKKIIEFLSNFGPIIKTKIIQYTFICGDIIIVNNSGNGYFEFSGIIIKNIDDIMKYFPNIYKYQIIKDQKLVLQ